MGHNRIGSGDMLNERGATAVLVASMMIVLLGMAAIAVDVGAGFNDRRQGQTAADVAVMAGAIHTVSGSGVIRTQVLDLVERNLDQTFTAAEYQALWEGCVDPVSDRNTEVNDDFVALPAPPGWTLVDAANWCISADDSKGLLRVRIPDQISQNSFGQVIGSDELITNAAAVAEISLAGAGGVLPFGLGNGATGGALECLSSGPTGNAVDPCSGGSSGNYGAIIIRQFGNATLGTPENCPNVANPGRTLAQNIATGADHLLVTTPDTTLANEVRDYACDTPFPNTVDVDPGFPNNSTEQGLVGPVPGGYTPRLQQSGPTRSVFNKTVNDVPLWTYLLAQSSTGTDGLPDYQGTFGAADAPASCDPASFSGAPFDWDGDGTADPAASWQHMQRCLSDYAAGSFTAVIISDTILSNVSRFAYVPQFHETMTNPQWKHIQRFRAVYLQSTAWKKGNTYEVHNPGEACTCSGNGYSLWGLSAFTFPDAALPQELRGNPIPGSIGLNPFAASLKR